MKWLEEQGGKKEAQVCRGRGAPDGGGQGALSGGRRTGEREHPLESTMQHECQGTEQEQGVEGGGLDWTEPRGWQGTSGMSMRHLGVIRAGVLAQSMGYG